MKRPGGSLLVSIALHVVLGAGLIWVLSIPSSFHDWMGLTPPPKEPAERVDYVALPSGGGGGGARQRSHGVSRRRARPPRPPR